MDLAAAFGEIGLAFSGAFGGPYWDAQIITRGEPEYDDGGSIVPGSGETTLRPCQAQVDSATESMRQSEGFVDQDRRILVLAGSFEGEISTDDRIEVLNGPFAGLWLIESVTRDPAAIGFEMRGRKA